MSACNYIQIVNPNTCLGDSLVTFNSNFSALDEGLCRQPDIVAGKGIRTISRLSEQQHKTIDISTRNSFVYSTKFDSTILANTVNVPVVNGYGAQGISFPRASADSAFGPLATFSTVSLTETPPSVTIFWTASGVSNSTLYTTNSSTSASTDIGSFSSFNGPITCLLSSGNVVYVGGEFTAVGEVNCKKFCVVNLNAGTYVQDREFAGTLVSSPLTSDGGLGNVGTVNAIAEYQNLIILGGSFQGLKGRGLTILNKSTGSFYPFYVNGDVHCLLVLGDYLYIGGNFDYINYTERSASIASGSRVYANGLAQISLALVTNFPNNSIVRTFCANVNQRFYGRSSINTLASKNNVIYIGGLFDAYVGTELVASNIAILNSDGTTSLEWKPIIQGTVNTFAIDGNYLYVGGAFDSYLTALQYTIGPTIADNFHNALCLNITGLPTIEYNWKPKFNGPISSFCFHDSEFGTYVYCSGNFTQVNGVDTSYLGVVNKSFNNSIDGQTPLYWTAFLDKPPAPINQALLRYGYTVVTGGNFQKINGISRNYLARVSGLYQENYTYPAPEVIWNLGAQLCTPGTYLGLDSTAYVSVTANPGPYGTINQTSFNSQSLFNLFKNYSQGSLMRFFIQRSSQSATKPLSSDAYVIGWKVDFN